MLLSDMATVQPTCDTLYPMKFQPATLATLERDGRMLWVYCCDCCHERDIPPMSLGLQPDTPIPEVSRRLKCGRCGSKRISAKPQLHALPVHEMRERRRELGPEKKAPGE